MDPYSLQTEKTILEVVSAAVWSSTAVVVCVRAPVSSCLRLRVCSCLCQCVCVCVSVIVFVFSAEAHRNKGLLCGCEKSPALENGRLPQTKPHYNVPTLVQH